MAAVPKSFKTVLKRRNKTLELLKKLAQQLKVEPATRWNVALLNMQLEKLNKFWKEFQDCSIQISSSKGAPDQMLEDNEDQALTASQIVTDIRERLDGMIRVCDPMRFRPTPKASEVMLEKFDGEYSKWTAWRGAFQSKVLDTALSADSKIGLLLGALDGNARKCAGDPEHHDEDELQRMWAKLNATYDNPYQIVTAHINCILDIPQLTQPDTTGLQNIINVCEQELRSLRRFGYEVEGWSPLMAVLMLRKLDRSTRRRWEMDRDPSNPPTLQEVTEYLKRRIHAFDNSNAAREESNKPVETSRLNLKRNEPPGLKGPPAKRSFRPRNTWNEQRAPAADQPDVNRAKSGPRCLLCKGPHRIYHCEKLMNLEIQQRQAKVNEVRLCRLCLGEGHHAESCAFRGCRNCNDAKHNRLLCPKASVMRVLNVSRNKRVKRGHERQVLSISASNAYPESLQDTTSGHYSELPVIGTALFKIQQPYKSVTGDIRALCDSGSQLNLITEDCVQRWRLNRVSSDCCIVGVGISSPIVAKGSVDALLVDRLNQRDPWPVRFMIVPKIAGHHPLQSFNCSLRDQLKDRDLADPIFDTPGKVDALLGIGAWSAMVEEGIIRSDVSGHHLIAQKSRLGWVIAGSAHQSAQSASFSFHVEPTSHALDAQLERFWNIEDVGDSKVLSAEEQLAEDNFIATHTRDAEGRYIVTIPFRKGIVPLGNSRSTAFNRFVALERRLQKIGNEELAAAYMEFMEDYIKEGHLVLAPPAPSDPAQSYYVPHHIINKKKFRVVFDASCATSSGISLNDIQLPGPKLQPDLYYTLLLFRTYRYALTADIVKMYRQVKVHPSQHNFQRIFYRESNNKPIREYFITRVIWGFTSAGFNAVRSLQQCAIDHGADHPIAVEAVENNFYMDDLLAGADNIGELLELRQQLIDLLSCGGFELAKWGTNSSEVSAEMNQTEINLTLKSEAGVLGMLWRTDTDELQIKVADLVGTEKDVLTKRQVISCISQVYDPTGLFIPVVLLGKIIIQSIWKLNLAWDENVPESIMEKFTEFRSEVRKLADVTVPRWLGTTNGSKVQLHVFSDASERAYGACAYIRSEIDGQIRVCLVTSRNRVAPIKSQTIPRLELMGAVMATELADFVIVACKLRDAEVHFWSDSTIVLYWIQKDGSLLKPFVANRVAAILKHASISQWHHVPGDQNPADMLSRGCQTDRLKSSAIWWEGPSWLALPAASWPKSPLAEMSQYQKEADQLESKTIPLVAHLCKPQPLSVINQNLPEVLDTRQSTLNKLLRVTAFCFRFIKNARCHRTGRKKRLEGFKKVPSLTPIERDEALFYWVKLSQSESFPGEWKALQEGRSVPPNSKLSQLYPFIDAQGVIRVGGRLGRSELPTETRHQIILDRKSNLAAMIIRDAHNRVIHGGTQMTMGYVRQKFWMVQLRLATRKVINECVVCVRFRKEHAQQLMGSLPPARTRQAFPFLHSGVDFAGPFEIRKTVAPKMVLRRSNGPSAKSNKETLKCWVVIFICMATRAVHIDLSYGLSVEAFLECFTRFCSRRGQCKQLWSDNGTNFVGANKELQRVRKEWADRFPDKELANCGTSWQFIAPGAPHQGGLWEACVRSMKHHLRRVVGRRVLSGNQLYTVVTQIEGCLNSRPLTPLTDDPTDLEALTPAHLLIGRAVSYLPCAEDLAACNDNRLTMWGIQQKILQSFWHRWRNDYLISLQKRNKWRKARTNLQIDDMVIVASDNLPPAFWPLGRVIQIHPGSDGLVRNVTVKTSNGEKTRPVQKLCLLPKESCEPVPLRRTLPPPP